MLIEMTFIQALFHGKGYILCNYICFNYVYYMRCCYKDRIGMGDIKLLAMIGLYQGFSGMFSSLFMSLTIAFIIAIVY